MLQRNRAIVAIAFAGLLASAGPVAAAAAAKFVLGGANSAPSTTTIQMAAPGAVLSLQNSHASGGGLNVTVPAGRAPITVSAGAGKATNLDADKLDGHDASDFVQGPAEAWHEIASPGEVSWSWFGVTNWGDPYETTGYMKDPFGFVHLKGRVIFGLRAPTGCDAFALFQLPAGDRPAAIVTETTLAHDSTTFTDGLAWIDILANGNVSICHPDDLDRYSWIGLDGITFSAAQ